jgi:signal transduction histidine kinase
MLADSTLGESSTHSRRQERLLAASRLLNSTLDVAELTKIVLQIVQDEVPVDRCTLFVVDRRQKLLRSFVAQGVEESEITLPIGEGLAGTVAATGKPLEVHDVYMDARFQQRFDEEFGYRTKDVLCLPIFNCHRDLIGVLELLNRLRPLHSADRDFVSDICIYIGLALHNAWIHRELKESRAAEEQLRLLADRLAESEKRSALNELVTGIIHEMKNPLSIAVGHCGLLREESQTTPRLALRVDAIRGAIDGALKVAQNFLNFARATGNERVSTDPNTIIRQTADLLAYQFRFRTVALGLDLKELPLVRIDPSSIQQVLLNILKNAQEAACEKKEGGTVSVRSSYDSKKSAVRIEVTDDGPGIPTTTQSRLFEPFFTTKPKGAGTGLGLAISRRIIEQHHGTLSFQSAAGQGTTFVIELPPASRVMEQRRSGVDA